MPSGVGPRPPMDADYAQRPLVPPQRAAAPAWTFNQPAPAPPGGWGSGRPAFRPEPPGPAPMRDPGSRRDPSPAHKAPRLSEQLLKEPPIPAYMSFMHNLKHPGDLDPFLKEVCMCRLDGASGGVCRGRSGTLGGGRVLLPLAPPPPTPTST